MGRIMARIEKFKSSFYPHCLCEWNDADVNPIENVFHLEVKALEKDTMEQVITHETFEPFVGRVRRILHAMPISVIDKTIQSVEKRINLIIDNKGKRLKY